MQENIILMAVPGAAVIIILLVKDRISAALRRRRSTQNHGDGRVMLTVMPLNFCCSECAARVSLSIRGRWRRIAERLLHAMHALLLIVLLAVAVGCAPTAGTHDAAVSGGSLDEARVLVIARAAVATNDTWIDRAEFETPKRQPDGSWSVLVWRRPATPGGHRFITIDAKGKVTDYGRGL